MRHLPPASGMSAESSGCSLQRPEIVAVEMTVRSTRLENFPDKPVMNAGSIGIIAGNYFMIIDPIERGLTGARVIE